MTALQLHCLPCLQVFQKPDGKAHPWRAFTNEKVNIDAFCLLAISFVRLLQSFQKFLEDSQFAWVTYGDKKKEGAIALRVL